MSSPRPANPAGNSKTTVDAVLAVEISELAGMIAGRLFAAGLDLNYVLMLSDEDSPVVSRARHAVGEIDEALADLRRLVVRASQR
jgi:uncharacterized protein YgfB (UPF0149 family)